MCHVLVKKFIYMPLCKFVSSPCSSGMTCPPTDFVEESFLVSVKEFLSEGGLFVINLVSRSLAIREMVVSKMKVVRTKWKGFFISECLMPYNLLYLDAVLHNSIDASRNNTNLLQEIQS